MKQEIEVRLAINLNRVRNLIERYPATGSGRRSVADSDLLRAAVVLLHATLEDVIRGVLEWKLPTAAPAGFAELALAGVDDKGKALTGEKFTVPQLVQHRGKTVDDVLAETVRASLARSNYNNPGEIDAALTRVGLSRQLVDPTRARIAAMMTRRHWIVHRADRYEAPAPSGSSGRGRGNYATKTIDKLTVEDWLDAVSNLTALILNNC
jgi:hypothetical protein